MTYKVGDYGRERFVPMTEVFVVHLVMDYEWAEGRLFRHDETGLYAWITEAGCSCNGFLELVDDANAFMTEQVWAPLEYHVPEIARYIDSDLERWHGDRNGPAWRTERRAALNLLLREARSAVTVTTADPPDDSPTTEETT